MEKEDNILQLIVLAVVAILGIVSIISTLRLPHSSQVSLPSNSEELVGQAIFGERCTAGWLNQPYCQNGNVWDKYRSLTCGTTFKQKTICQNGCLNGACRKTCTAQWLNQPYCNLRNVWDKWQNTDCTIILKQKLACNNGCANGACNTEKYCNDTDGGINLDVVGQCSDNFPNAAILTHTDSCINGHVTDYFCGTSGYCVGYDVLCINGCNAERTKCATAPAINLTNTSVCTEKWWNESYCINGNVVGSWLNSDCSITAEVKEICSGGCSNGACTICTPNCAGKICGNNGCGGTCGTCSNGYSCSKDQAQCSKSCPTVCKESGYYYGGCYAPSEDWSLKNPHYWLSSSGQACYYQWNKRVNDPSCSELYPSIPDCWCYNWEICVLPEQCISPTAGCCAPQCTGKTCGDNGCGGTCGICPAGYTCNSNQCIASCTSQWMNTPYCYNNNVWDKWRNTDCTTTAKQKTVCTYGCQSGVCQLKPVRELPLMR